jgi:hypothetical protein
MLLAWWQGILADDACHAFKFGLFFQQSEEAQPLRRPLRIAQFAPERFQYLGILRV